VGDRDDILFARSGPCETLPRLDNVPVGNEISYVFLPFRGNERPIGVRIASVSETRHRQEISEDSEKEEEEKEEK